MIMTGGEGHEGSAAPVFAGPRDILILANPTAGGYRPKRLEQIRKNLDAAGYAVTLKLTSYAGEIGDLCSSAMDASILVIAGGDGSINEALAGFRSNPAPPILAIIPSGTANVLAHELKLPTRADAIVKSILQGKTAPLHAGLANGHPFVLMASAGFDAEVVHGIPLALKRKFGKLAYVMTALRIGFTRRSAKLTVDADGEILKGKLAVVTNGRCYGGPFVIAPEASVTRHGLHLLLLEKDDPLSSIRFGIALLMGRVHKVKGVKLRPIERVRILGQTPVAAQIDGDAFGATPIEIEAAQNSFEIIVP